MRDKAVDLTVVGPEDPLSMGIADELAPKGYKVFGPTRAAAELESSKVFAKRIMHKHGIPTAAFRIFEDAHDAHDYVAQVAGPIVVKADGLAKGKGVIVCASAAEAHDAIRQIMELRVFGRAGDRIVIEERLRGEEASILAITDGRTILPLEAAQDHKQIRDGDEGPNTGGMGAYSPVPRITAPLRDEIERRVFVPMVHGMRREGRRYQGVLYAGIMLTGSGPQVLEFNVRWGDPEAQPILMRMKSDIVPALLAASEVPEDGGIGGTLKEMHFEWDERPAVCVVMASAGYPGDYEKGKPISWPGRRREAEGRDGVPRRDGDERRARRHQRRARPRRHRPGPEHRRSARARLRSRRPNPLRRRTVPQRHRKPGDTVNAGLAISDC